MRGSIRPSTCCLFLLESGHLVNQDTLSSVLNPTMYMYVVSPAVVEAQVEAIAQREGLTLEEAKVSRDSIYPVSVLCIELAIHSIRCGICFSFCV